MCDYEDYTLPSTDDFYTYNQRFDVESEMRELEASPGAIDGYDEDSDADSFLAEVRQAELWGHVPDSEYN
jgi:hypothetical protein